MRLNAQIIADKYINIQYGLRYSAPVSVVCVP